MVSRIKNTNLLGANEGKLLFHCIKGFFRVLRLNGSDIFMMLRYPGKKKKFFAQFRKFLILKYSLSSEKK